MRSSYLIRETSFSAQIKSFPSQNDSNQSGEMYGSLAFQPQKAIVVQIDDNCNFNDDNCCADDNCNSNDDKDNDDDDGSRSGKGSQAPPKQNWFYAGN